jgi:hypothetical protein
MKKRHEKKEESLLRLRTQADQKRNNECYSAAIRARGRLPRRSGEKRAHRGAQPPQARRTAPEEEEEGRRVNKNLLMLIKTR